MFDARETKIQQQQAKYGTVGSGMRTSVDGDGGKRGFPTIRGSLAGAGLSGISCAYDYDSRAVAVTGYIYLCTPFFVFRVET